MKKFITGLMFVAVASMVAVSCGKYEEGPGFSLRTKKGRVAGEWEVDKYVSSNGTETQDQYNSTATYEKDGTFTSSSDFGSYTGTWEFGDKKETIITTVSVTIGGTTQTSKDTATIIRLTNSEFWTQDEDGDQVHLKAK